MSNLTQKEGMELAAFSFTVERGKIKEFVQAIGDMNPVYTDREHAVKEGYNDVIAPPTFGTVIDLWGGPDFQKLCALLEINPLKVLHGEQEYEYGAAIYPGDVITARQKVGGVSRKEGKRGGMNFISLDTTYVNQHHEQVLAAKCVIAVRD
jgi:acyl dehydratase